MKETTFEEQSSLKIYSLGIVIKAEDPTTKEIMVSPIETMNVQAPGMISANKIEFRGSHADDKGISTSGNVKAENYVKAKWISIGTSNRVTSPTVYPNETVLLFRYSNNDVFYWTSIFHEADLRKKESATFGFSNMSVGKGWAAGAPVAFGKDTGYWVEIDAVKKLVSLTTPDNEGEFAKYTFEIDAVKSILTIKDNKSNTIKIESKKGIEVTSDLKTVVRGKAGVDVESSSVINLKAPNVIASGNLIVKGKLTANGLGVTGSATISGDITCGNIFCKSVTTGGSSAKMASAGGTTNGGSSGGSSSGTSGTGGTMGGGSGTSNAITGTFGLGEGGGSSSIGDMSGSVLVMTGGVVDDYPFSTDVTKIRNPDGTYTTNYGGPATVNANGDLVHAATGTVIQTASDRERQYNSPDAVAGRTTFANLNNGTSYESVFGTPNFAGSGGSTTTNADADASAFSGVRPSGALPATSSEIKTTYWSGPSHTDASGNLVHSETGSTIQTARDRNEQQNTFNQVQNGGKVADTSMLGLITAGAAAVGVGEGTVVGDMLINALKNN